jgi:hypothetical protein
MWIALSVIPVTLPLEQRCSSSATTRRRDGGRRKIEGQVGCVYGKGRPGPEKSGRILALDGVLGASTDSKQTRIYWDPSLSSYADIDTADIIHAEPLPKEQSPLGGSYIWVKRSAEVSVSAGGQTTKGKFFQGPVMSAYEGTFGAAAGAAHPAFVGSYAPHCWYSWDACPTMYGCGPHHTPACPQAPMAAGVIPPSTMCPRTPHHGCATWIGCATGFCARSGLGDPCHPFTPARPRCP